MTQTPLKAPFVYFGGKAKIAPFIWQLLGDPSLYIEPFCGSSAVLLQRPANHRANKTEIINDIDGYLVNVWRSIKHDPSAVAEHFPWMMSQVDYAAAIRKLVEEKPSLAEQMRQDLDFYNPRLAAVWLYANACSINANTTRALDRDQAECNIKPLITGDNGVVFLQKESGRIGRLLAAISKRLQHCRIINGEWQSGFTPSILKRNATVGVFLDPPYDTGENVYGKDLKHISAEVRDWCLDAPADYRLVLAGYDAEHDELLQHGWRKYQGKAGQGNGFSKNDNRLRERLWASPACLDPHAQQLTLV